MEGEVMEYLIVAAVALLAGSGAGAYLHYRYGSKLRYVEAVIKSAVEQAKSK